MKKSKTNNGKTFWLGFMLIAGAIPSTAQEKLEIQITKEDGVSRTIEVDRDIEELNLRGLTSITLPNGLTNLEVLDLDGNYQLTNVTLPGGLTNLVQLKLSHNQLTSLILPDGLTNLEYLDLSFTRLTSLILPDGLTNLKELLLYNQLSSLTLPEGLTNLEYLNLGNRLTSLTLPEGLTNLEELDLSYNRLTSLTLPKGLTNLKYLDLRHNQLRNLFLSPDTASRHKRLNLYIEDNPWMRIRQLVGLNIEFVVGPEHYGISDYDLPASPKISQVENGWEISWDAGVLQIAASVDGPWHDVNLQSPVKLQRHLISSIPAEFFRVRSKEQWIDVERRILPLK